MSYFPIDGGEARFCFKTYMMGKGQVCKATRKSKAVAAKL